MSRERELEAALGRERGHSALIGDLGLRYAEAWADQCSDLEARLAFALDALDRQTADLPAQNRDRCLVVELGDYELS